ncbi:cyclophilin-like fold protein [Haloplanus pelagicus]|uniref:cyclophilin-like fold protein n=1 Tax=Haloplanus pelagicus TaxID=2949995 RepID=UPI00203DF863|nr:cyclophilin-like fold protein [Haloplanus sp. HW8-1]
MSEADFVVTVNGTEIDATWAEESPETRRALADALPVEGEATRWGDELYFRVPVDVDAEDPRVAVDPGTIAYWPQGSALCLFWGPTPASTDATPRAASPVNVVARLADVAPLSALPSGAGATVRITDD